MGRAGRPENLPKDLLSMIININKFLIRVFCPFSMKRQLSITIASSQGANQPRVVILIVHFQNSYIVY